jgi:hypothetical protein
MYTSHKRRVLLCKTNPTIRGHDECIFAPRANAIALTKRLDRRDVLREVEVAFDLHFDV